MPDTSSEFADEGTAAHTLASMALTESKDALAYLGRIIKVERTGQPDNEFEVDEDMAGYVQTYIDLVRQLAEGGTLLVEQRVPIDHMTSEEGAEGTSDVIIITADGDELIDIDLKYGRGVKVFAEDNEQLLMYASGAVRKFGLLGDFKRIRVLISQPRVSEAPSEWTITIDELREFEKRAASAALSVRNAFTFHKTGVLLTQGLSYFAPGDKQCRWCKAKATCPALAREISKTVLDDFEVLGNPHESATPVPVPADAARLGVFRARVELIEEWCRAVCAAVDNRLNAGEPVPGWKLVDGKKGNRAWGDKTQVEEALKAARLKHEEMYSYALISPTQAEKKLKKEKPRVWKRLMELITQAAGKPSVAPESDPRPAVQPGATADDFADETDIAA